MPIVERPGVYDIPPDTYHADAGVCPQPSLSVSGSRLLLSTCPAVFWHQRTEPPQRTDAMMMGDLAHQWLIEGAAFEAHYMRLPDDYDGRTKEGKAIKQQLVAENRIGIKASKWDVVEGMHAALKRHPWARSLYLNGKPEQSLYWKDKETGIWLRARLDYLRQPSNYIPDYKTTMDASPAALQRSCFAYGYFQQAAHYLDGAQALGLCEEPTHFLFAFQETRPPYLVVVVELDQEAIGWGRIINRRARHLFADCLERGEWPGYADDILALPLPSWGLQRLQQQHDAGTFTVEEEPDTSDIPETPPEWFERAVLSTPESRSKSDD